VECEGCKMDIEGECVEKEKDGVKHYYCCEHCAEGAHTGHKM